MTPLRVSGDGLTSGECLMGSCTADATTMAHGGPLIGAMPLCPAHFVAAVAASFALREQAHPTGDPWPARDHYLTLCQAHNLPPRPWW